MPGAGGLIDDLLRRRVLILTGKGGVGKSTTSAALALLAANDGKRVLVIEVDAKGNVPDFFDTRRVGFKYRRLHKNVWGLSMQPKDSMQEYLSLMLHLPGFSLKPMQGFIEYTSGAIPGLKEILVTGKVYYEENASENGGPRWDLIVVDGAPTGHVVSQLGAARHLSTLVRSGPIHDQAVRIANLLSDVERTAVVLVTIAEEMPVSETIDLADRFADETDITPAALLVNQLQPEIVSDADLPAFKRLVSAAGRKDFLQRYPDGDPLLGAGEMMLEAQGRSQHLGKLLARSLKLPTLNIPYVFQRNHGFAFTRTMARALDDLR
ncbi:MAG TPA: ArsA family ATPase [Candidatus Solibacter sp.]|jgi:anion-transporting  ArsA/GET3 family ATPase|nr:ArsA family ATPase [Candidatus Solibacter sp.]